MLKSGQPLMNNVLVRNEVPPPPPASSAVFEEQKISSRIPRYDHNDARTLDLTSSEAADHIFPFLLVLFRPGR